MNTKSRKVQNCEALCDGVLRVRLYDSGGNKIPINGAGIKVLEWKLSEWQHIRTRVTDDNGYAVFELPGGDSHQYGLAYENAFGFHEEPAACSGDEPQGLFSIDCNCTKQINLGVPVNFTQQLVMLSLIHISEPTRPY